MDLRTGAGVRPDEPGVRVISQRFFDFLQVQRIFLTLGGDVGMQHHRQIVFGGQVIYPLHRFIIGPRGIASGQCRQVIMAGEHFADALPQPRIQIEQALDVRQSSCR
jgi:hypothetical protein